MRKFFSAGLTMVCLCLLFPGSLSAQEPITDQEMMVKWQAFATPGEGHKLLARMAGEWNVDSRFWLKPGAPPLPSPGMATGRMILGGRYLEMKHKGSFMGKPLNGIALAGFNNHLQRFESVWIDNTGTGVFFYSGTADKSGRVINEFGVMDDVITGKKIKVKSVTTFKDADHFEMEMFNVNEDGTLFRTMQALYTRKQ